MENTNGVDQQKKKKKRIIHVASLKHQRLMHVFFVFAAFVLSLAVSIQLHSTKEDNSLKGNKSLNELRDRLSILTEESDSYKQAIERKERLIEKYRSEVANTDNTAQYVKNEINENNIKLGYTELTGKGIIVTLRDGEEKKISLKDNTQLIVHDIDILEIINVLRNAGAEAISVNGQRVVAPTAITCIGTVIKINDEKVGSPYQIQAIGNVDYLQNAITMPGGISSVLEQYGVQVSVEKSNNIKIPKYTGRYFSDTLRDQKEEGQNAPIANIANTRENIEHNTEN